MAINRFREFDDRDVSILAGLVVAGFVVLGMWVFRYCGYGLTREEVFHPTFLCGLQMVVTAIYLAVLAFIVCDLLITILVDDADNRWRKSFAAKGIEPETKPINWRQHIEPIIIIVFLVVICIMMCICWLTKF